MTVEMYDRCWAAVPDCLRQAVAGQFPCAVRLAGAGARQPLPALVPETVAGAPVAGVRLSV